MRERGRSVPGSQRLSFGRWEGDKLIVETTHLKEAVDQGRYPHSENAKIVEEYSLVVNDDGTKVLTSKMTMTDPDFYTQTITAEKKWQFQPASGCCRTSATSRLGKSISSVCGRGRARRVELAESGGGFHEEKRTW